MLRMRIVRAPLRDEENKAILNEYNRLTRGQIPLNELVFRFSTLTLTARELHGGARLDHPRIGGRRREHLSASREKSRRPDLARPSAICPAIDT